MHTNGRKVSDQHRLRLRWFALMLRHELVHLLHQSADCLWHLDHMLAEYQINICYPHLFQVGEIICEAC